MPKYHIIVSDVQAYDFYVDAPAGLSEDALEDFIWDFLADNRDAAWKSGEETIDAIDLVTPEVN
jgi:hypothetical protein